MTIQSPPQKDDRPDSDGGTVKSDADIFDTSHLKADIRGHSVRGGVATVASQAVKLLLQTGSTAVLARILTKEDYGLIAMVAFFTEFVNLFKDLGLSTATIQKKDITHQHS